jgi:hypothetical protein
VPAMVPNRLPQAFSGDGGITSATGWPKRVTRIGFRVLRTSSRMPRHLALNSEMAIFFVRKHYTMVKDYGQNVSRLGLRRVARIPCHPKQGG